MFFRLKAAADGPSLLAYKNTDSASLNGAECIFIRNIVSQIEREHLRSVCFQHCHSERRALPLFQSMAGSNSYIFLPWLFLSWGCRRATRSTAFPDKIQLLFINQAVMDGDDELFTFDNGSTDISELL